MKRAVILHGTDATPNDNWFPWLQQQLEAKGYQVWVPQLPNSHAPSMRTYNDFLLNSDWDFTDSVVIGHSAGAVSVLNLLMDERCPKISLGIIVSAWAQGYPAEFDPEEKQFDHLFPEHGYDFALLRSKADRFAFFHGDDDPYCPLAQAEYLAEELNAPLTVIKNGGHIGGAFKELPVVNDVITSAT